MYSICLSIWEEAVGRLDDVCLRDAQVEVNLAGVGIVVMPFRDGLLTQLQEMKGRRVSILRTNLPQREYLIRMMDTTGHHSPAETTKRKGPR